MEPLVLSVYFLQVHTGNTGNEEEDYVPLDSCCP